MGMRTSSPMTMKSGSSRRALSRDADVVGPPIERDVGDEVVAGIHFPDRAPQLLRPCDSANRERARHRNVRRQAHCVAAAERDRRMVRRIEEQRPAQMMIAQRNARPHAVRADLHRHRQRVVVARREMGHALHVRETAAHDDSPSHRTHIADGDVLRSQGNRGGAERREPSPAAVAARGERLPRARPASSGARGTWGRLASVHWSCGVHQFRNAPCSIQRTIVAI